MSRPNVFADGPWDLHEEEMQINGQLVGKAAGAKELGMSVYDLLPGLQRLQPPFPLRHPELGKIGVTTRHPFTPAPEHGDKGIIAMFDLPNTEK